MSGVYAQAAAPGGKSSSSSSSSDSSKSSIWSSGLCSCMENCGICCMGLFCYPYQMIKVEKAVHGKDKDFECSDWCCCVCQCALYYGVGFWCLTAYFDKKNREEIRHKWHFPEDDKQDCLYSYCCCTCANCQNAREIEERKK
eukprot:TRINITY_DN1038_c0_g1_i2.p1 TRINITY_DN1038_c0_g1~~TRINITY_DN1038_c0_g1_i2.p1  ORF type:complete len:142 (-),score=20.61 TRINITY_DN1038_c0_g1_i2:220-645(-)